MLEDEKRRTEALQKLANDLTEKLKATGIADDAERRQAQDTRQAA